MSNALAFLGRDMAVDLGTANTLVYVRGRGIVLNEPSVVALNTNTGAIVAVGVEAKRMIGRTPGNIVAVRPLKDGVIADFDVTERMLRYFIQKVHRRRHLAKPRVVVAVPSGITGVEQSAVKEAGHQAGARRVYIIEEPMAAAIGAGLPVNEPTGNMVVDIGGGTTEVAVISLGGIVTSQSIRVAGDELDQAIITFGKKEYSLMLGDRTAEEIKMALGSAYPSVDEPHAEIRGRDLVSGLPKTIVISAEEIRRAIEEPVALIVDTVKTTLDKCPPELAGDVMDRGIALSRSDCSCRTPSGRSGTTGSRSTSRRVSARRRPPTRRRSCTRPRRSCSRRGSGARRARPRLALAPSAAAPVGVHLGRARRALRARAGPQLLRFPGPAAGVRRRLSRARRAPAAPRDSGGARHRAPRSARDRASARPPGAAGAPARLDGDVGQVVLEGRARLARADGPDCARLALAHAGRARGGGDRRGRLRRRRSAFAVRARGGPAAARLGTPHVPSTGTRRGCRSAASCSSASTATTRSRTAPGRRCSAWPTTAGMWATRSADGRLSGAGCAPRSGRSGRSRSPRRTSEPAAPRHCASASSVVPAPARAMPAY